MPPRRPPDPLRSFHPIVRAWFAETLGTPSAPQRAGWPAIAGGGHTLILAPTGTGKTLAAFLWELDQLVKDGLATPLPNAVRIVYVSPLKALNNDVQRNLEGPLAALRERFERAGEAFPEIRVAVRTGDTPASARARMLRKSPHILITTPESLNIMLTTERGRGMFSAARVVIVDEIHAVAGTKRGAHLALTLERLERLVVSQGGAAPQRIGLSATQRPLEEIARFLGGVGVEGSGVGDQGSRGGHEGTGNGEPGREPRFPVPGSPFPSSGTGDAPSTTPDPGLPIPPFRPVTIVDCGLVKEMELRVVSPVADMDEIAGSVWPKVVDVVHAHALRVRTTLVFVNNRALAERIAARLNAQAEEELAQPYHGSLARERRQLLEERLKAGELRVLVATSSLELGIDIGSVDLVVQLQSPKRVSAALQRVGRAGHTLGAVSRGVLVPTFRDDAVEIAAIAAAMGEGAVEPTRVPQNALDVLAQQLVAAASVDDWTSAGLFALARGAYPYHRLTRNAFDEVLGMLSGKYAADLASELEPRLTWDRVSDRVSGSRRSRMMAVISGGTIPDRGYYTVNLPDRTRLGELDEEFVHESRVGDAFQLGSTTWRIAAIEHDRVVVLPAPGAPARMPFWHGEFMSRSLELGRRVGELRREIAEGWLERDASTSTHTPHSTPSRGVRSASGSGAGREDGRRSVLDPATVSLLTTYVGEQRAATGTVPDERTVVVEHFRDELGAVRIVLHSVFGGRVNAPWGMALAQRVREALDVDPQLQTTDDGIMLRLPDLGAPPPLEVVLRLPPDEAVRRVMEEVGTTSLFGARFRMNAARALLLPRQAARRRMPLWLQRLKALDLLETVRQWPAFPILVETYREVLQDAFDLEALRGVLADIEAGRIGVRVVETEVPSPFAASLQFGFVVDWLYADDTPRAERRAAMLSLDRSLLDDVLGVEPDEDTLRAMDAVLAARRGTAPGRQARTTDELAHLLDRAGDLTPEELRARVAPPAEWRGGDPLAALLAAGRAVALAIPVGEAPPASRDASAAGPAPHRAGGGDSDSPRPDGPPASRDSGAEGAGEDRSVSWRIVPTESVPRWLAAFDRVAGFGARVLAGPALVERDAAEVIPAPLRIPSVERRVARREILARWIALAGPVTVAEARARYAFPARWIEARLDEWARAGRLVRGRFRPGVSEPEWCWRRVAEAARRRALAELRRQIEAVELRAFAAFLHRWQHLDPRDRLEGPAGVERILAQLGGLARPATAWEREILPARLRRYDPAWLSQLAASGRWAWAGEPARDRRAGVVTLAGVRFLERGEGALWLAASPDEPPGEGAGAVHDALVRHGASFVADLAAATGLGMVGLREALRELVAAGLVTNDSVEALREVARATPLTGRARPGDPDPTRWLPAGFSPSANRHVVQRRPNPRRLPKWRRPDAAPVAAGWVGRWSLLRTPGTMGPERPAEELAEQVARRWLDRYGIVARDWWRRERPAVPWRAIYHELRRMEMRGEVRRGYFVRGLAGAQFALPEAVERVREAAGAAEAPDEPLVVLAASDPANVWSLRFDPVALAAAERDPLGRPRGAGALLVSRGGRVLLAAEGRGRRVSIAAGLETRDVEAAARALGEHVAGTPGIVSRRPRELVVESIDGAGAIGSPHREAFLRAGFRVAASGLVWRGG